MIGGKGKRKGKKAKKEDAPKEQIKEEAKDPETVHIPIQMLGDFASLKVKVP